MQGGGAAHGPVVLAALLAAALALPFAAAQPWPRCDSKSGNYSASSTYEDNLFQLITDLRANASSSPSLFASGSVGAGATAVYGLLLCRGDVSSSDCFDCGTLASLDVQRACNRTRDVALCYNHCYVRFSNADFLASPTNSGKLYLMSSTNVSTGVDVTAYDGVLKALLHATERYAVENSTRMFATGQLVGLDPWVPSVWSMAKCAADLSRPQCRRCLDGLVAKWLSIFPTNAMGARIAGARCNLRSELENSFYTGGPMVKLQMDGQVAELAPASSVDALPGTVAGECSLATLWPSFLFECHSLTVLINLQVALSSPFFSITE
jgi:hypothetical protein